VARAPAPDARASSSSFTRVPASSEFLFSKFIDLNMMVMTGGRERTETEFRALYEAAGFRLDRVVPTESPFSVIEAVKV